MGFSAFKRNSERLRGKKFGPFANIRLRSKILSAFAALTVLVVLNLGVIYLGYQDINKGQSAFRASVASADIARDIDREITAYQSLTRYFALSGEEADARAALASEGTARATIVKAVAMANRDGQYDAMLLARSMELKSQFDDFAKLLARTIALKTENAAIAGNQITRVGTMLRYKLEDLSDSAGLAGAASLQTSIVDSTTQLISASASANTFAARPDMSIANGALARITFIQKTFAGFTATNDSLKTKMSDIAAMLEAYRASFAKLIDNSKAIAVLVADMNRFASGMIENSKAMKNAVVAEQETIDRDARDNASRTEQIVGVLTIVQLIGALLLAFLIGGAVSRPIVAMCAAMRELAGGRFDIVLPGLGRKDEIGQMAAAVEGFKVAAIEKARRDATEQDEKNRTTGQARRAELIRFAR